ncbi:MAG: hypothetical protein FJY21_01915 [Bacteroidetes bacterium]|nr:hypothetical protein [Bacteroidota bacterium]
MKYNSNEIETVLFHKQMNLYNRIDNLLNQKFDELPPDTISDLTSTLIELDDRIQSYKRDLKLNFPEVYEVFRLIKVKDHTLLARLSQRIESTIMIQYAAKRIAEEKPDLPIFTIHDSIATTVGNEDYVASVIKEEVLKLTGLKVKLGKEYWD